MIRARHERWPIAGSFTIARGTKTHADVVVVEIEDGNLGTPAVGHGECVPYGRYGETVESVVAAIEAIERGAPSSSLTGAARSAHDLASWELRARKAGTSVAALLGLAEPAPFESAITISIDAPDAMASAAARLADRSTLKLKLAGDGLDLERVRAVRSAAPRARLWVDANEGWDAATYDALAPRLAELGVALIEQPLPADRDGALAGRARPVPICADESAHGEETIAALADRYDVVNVKLDKAGGLTGALRAIEAARSSKLGVALGCMVSTSLAVAPACLLVPLADFVDLDGSILLAADRAGGARVEDGKIVPPTLWGR